MNKLNLFTWCGLIFITIWFISSKFIELNQSIHGMLIGLGFIFILLGILTQNYDILDFRDNQRKLFNRLFNRNKKRHRKI